MYLEAQKLNRRITIQRKVGGQDSLGQPVETWVDVCKLWSHIKTINGSGFINQEFHDGGKELSRTTASFRVRIRKGITADMRVLHQGQVYEIRVVLPDLQDNRYMDLGCAIGANQG
ncbi:MAG: phage head closure protein [Fluviibacter phosphoraccumulans]